MNVKNITSIFLLLGILSACSMKETIPTPIHQLRIYKIPTENRQVFHDRFRDHAHRIMKTYGFNIAAIWESQKNDTLEFVYLLEWKDKLTMEESWKKFMADEEWKEIKKTTSKLHGTFVESIEDRTLILTDYSPQKTLLKE
jgi:heme-degrading monooxygenase HmoA